MSIKNLALSLLLTSSTPAPALGHTTIGDGHLPIPVDDILSSKTNVFSLIGTEWQATEIEDAPLVPTDRGDLTVFFDSEKKSLSGFGGCNGFHSEWEKIIDSTGPAMFRSGPFVTNRVFCGEAIIDQERTFISALQGASAYSVSDDGEELVIYATAMRDDDEDTSDDAPHSFLHVGRPLVRLIRIPTLDIPEEDYRGESITVHFGDEVWDNASVDEEAEEGSSDDTEVDNSIFSLEDSSWQLTEVRGFAAIDDDSLPVTLSFNSDASSISGFDGCNRFNGPMDLLFGIDSLPSFRLSGPIRATEPVAVTTSWIHKRVCFEVCCFPTQSPTL